MLMLDKVGFLLFFILNSYLLLLLLQQLQILKHTIQKTRTTDTVALKFQILGLLECICFYL